MPEPSRAAKYAESLMILTWEGVEGFGFRTPVFPSEEGGEVAEIAYMVFVKVNKALVSEDEKDRRYAAFRFADKADFDAVVKAMAGRKQVMAYSGPFDEMAEKVDVYKAGEAIEIINLLTAERRASA